MFFSYNIDINYNYTINIKINRVLNSGGFMDPIDRNQPPPIDPQKPGADTQKPNEEETAPVQLDAVAVHGVQDVKNKRKSLPKPGIIPPNSSSEDFSKDVSQFAKTGVDNFSNERTNVPQIPEKDKTGVPQITEDVRKIPGKRREISAKIFPGFKKNIALKNKTIDVVSESNKSLPQSPEISIPIVSFKNEIYLSRFDANLDVRERFYFDVPMKIKNIEHFKECSAMAEAFREKGIEVYIRFHINEDMSELLFPKSLENPYKSIEFEDSKMSFTLKNDRYLEHAINTIQNVCRYGILTQQMMSQLGIRAMLSNDLSKMTNKVCTNYISDIEGIGSSLTNPARGGLCVVLEREKDDLKSVEMSKELAERAQHSILVVMQCTRVNRDSEYAQLDLVDTGGNQYKSDEAAFLPNTREGSCEVSTSHSIVASNLLYILVPKKMEPYLPLFNPPGGCKITLVQPITSTVPYRQKKVKILCPDYTETLERVVEAHGQILTHMIRLKTERDVKGEKPSS